MLPLVAVLDWNISERAILPRDEAVLCTSRDEVVLCTRTFTEKDSNEDDMRSFTTQTTRHRMGTVLATVVAEVATATTITIETTQHHRTEIPGDLGEARAVA